MKILVAYASKHGSTAEIAKTIGHVLRQRGATVEVMAVDAVKRLADYDAVVLGSAVYAGNWMKAGARFLLDQQDVLAQKTVWLFSSGPTGEGEPSQLMDGWIFPDELLAVVKKIQPRDMVFFHGKIDPDKLNLGERLIIKAVKAPTGDYRNWREIETWAEEMELEPIRS